MKYRQVIHDVLLIAITAAIVIGAWQWHEYDKDQYGQMMYQWGREDASKE